MPDFFARTGNNNSIDVYFPLMVLTLDTLLMIIAGGGAITMLLGVHTEWRLNRLLKGKDGASLEALILKTSSDIEKFRTFRKELETYLESVEKRLAQSVRGVSTVRFNPFKGTGEGGNISFATALLDAEGNGVVFSTLYTRERVGVYAKPLRKGASEFELTSEEKEAIRQAKEKVGT